VANDYCTWAEIEASNPDITWGATYDTIGALLVTRASRALDRECKVEPGYFYVSADTTRWFPGTGGTSIWIGALAAAPTTLSVAEGGDVDTSAGTGGTYTAWAAADYLLWPPNALLMGEPYRRLDINGSSSGGSKTVFAAGEKTVKIAGKFGYAVAVPEDIKQATIIQVTRWLQRARQGFQDTGAIVELGQLTYTKALDPDVALMIAHYQRKPRKGSQ